MKPTFVKFTFLILSLIFTNTIFCQTGEDFQTKNNLNFKIGETEDYSFHITSLRKDENVSEVLTYFRIPLKGGPVEAFEQEKLKIDGLTGMLTNSVVRDGRIIEHYLAFKPGMAILKKSVYIVERDPKTLKIVGEPKLVGEYSTASKKRIDGGGIRADDKGFFVSGVESKGNVDKLYLNRYDFNMNLLWSKDITSLNSKNEYKVTKMTFDEKDRSVLFNVNLSECEDCGLFKSKKVVSESIIGIVTYDADGNQSSILPEIPIGMVYSSLKLFSNTKDKTITGAFQIHEMGKNTSKQVNGLGYSICVWNQETGELLNSTEKMLTFKTVMGESAQPLLSFDSKLKIDLEENFPRLSDDFTVEKLDNDDILVLFTPLKGLDEDKYMNMTFNKYLLASCAYFCFNKTSELRWSTFVPTYANNYGMTTFHYGEISKNMGYHFLSYGNKDNYSSGSFNLKSNSTSGGVFVYGKMNLNTGEIVYRKSIKSEKKHFLFFNEFQNYIESSNTFLITTCDSNIGKVGAKAFLVETD